MNNPTERELGYEQGCKSADLHYTDILYDMKYAWEHRKDTPYDASILLQQLAERLNW